MLSALFYGLGAVFVCFALIGAYACLVVGSDSEKEPPCGTDGCPCDDKPCRDGDK